MRLRLVTAAAAFIAIALLAPAASPLPIGTQFRVSQMGPDGEPGFDALDSAVAYNSQANQYLVVWSGSNTTQGEFEIWGRLVDASGNPLGGNFRLSDVGPDGDPSFNAFVPGVAYNSQANEYLVTWAGDDLTVDNEYEIFGQRVSASGTEVGTNDFRISDMGPNGVATYRAGSATVAYNGQANEYLVVWEGDDDTAPLVDGEIEIFGQRLSAAGSELGTNDFRISDMGPDGNVNYVAYRPTVTYNPQALEYLVVWEGDDTSPLPDDEFEIFGQRLSATGAELGGDFRVSDLGPDGAANYNAFSADLTYNAQANEYLVVWGGDDNTAPLVDNEYEIYGQRLSAAGTELGTNDFRLSDMGPDGDAGYGARNPAVAYNGQVNEYLVVWDAEDGAPLGNDESEVFGQLLSAAGTEMGTNDVRISQMGPDGDENFEGSVPAVGYGSTPNEYLVTWQGDSDASPLVNQEFEIWARRFAPEPPPTAGPCTITGTPGNDVLTGTPGADRICALGGNDVVYGLGGDDRIVLGPGRDRAFGGRGKDTILGGKGPDRLSGGPGRDRLFGQRGRDLLLARDRTRDLVHGGPGFDRARVDRRRDVRRSIERLV